MTQTHPRILVIAGPTGVGKTELALQLAEQLPAEIVSVDSRQVYRRLDIGTAKPTTAQRRRAPHHLLDLIEPSESFSAGRFAAAAVAALQQVQARGHTALLVGGSGLYLSACLDGLFSAPQPDPSLRDELAARLHTEGVGALHEDLRRLDPGAADEIGTVDEVRVLRGLELALSDPRRRALRWQEDAGGGLRRKPIMVCLTRPRTALYRRIDTRALEMLEAGWCEEIRSLLDTGVGRDTPGMRSMGYAELVSHLVDGMPWEQAVEAIQRRTRQFAKRQMTWFRRDRRLRWLDVESIGSGGARDRILRQYEVQGRGR